MPVDRTTIAAWNLISRITGLVRVLAVAAAVGITYLGNTYQSANLVSNVVFELVAGGLLTVPLVPVFVKLLASAPSDRRADDASALAGMLTALVIVGLGSLAVVGALAGRQIMGLLTVGVSDPLIRAAQIDLGSSLLWLLLPQLVLYGVGAVATAALHAQGRFAAAAAAPVGNNVLVIATMAAFVASRRGGDPSLTLTAAQRLLLGLGTTAGVLVMTAIPVVAAAGARIRLRPVWRRTPGLLGQLGRAGAWGVLLLAANQGLVAVTLVLANRVEGGVVATQVAFALFLLPVALLAHPVFTAAHPRLSAEASSERWEQFAAIQGEGLRRILVAVVPAGAVLAVVAEPALAAARIGALGAVGAGLVGRVTGTYVIGLAGYAAFLFMTRSATAAGRSDLPATAALGVLVGGSLLMIAGSVLVSGQDRVVVIGVAHSSAWLIGAVVLGRRLAGSVGAWERVTPALGHGLVAGGLALTGGVGVRALVPTQSGRPAAMAATALIALAAGVPAGLWLAAFGGLRRRRIPVPAVEMTP